jgi:hypothetical protein
MRLLCFLMAIAVLFSLADASAAQPAYAATLASAQLPEGETARAAGLRMLTWPGKIEPARPRSQAQSASAPAEQPLRIQRYWDPRPHAAQAPVPVQAQVQAQPQPEQAQPALPTRAVAAAQLPPAQTAQAAPRAVAQASSSAEDDYQPTHFYSLHRQYGDTPDPIPLNAQFFASSTPDLAQPPPPAPRTVTTSTGRVIQQAPASPDGDPS